MPWIFRGLRNGVLTTRYPRRADEYAEHGVRALAEPTTSAHPEPELEDLCPTSAITVDPGAVRVDQGLCIGCGHCIQQRPDAFTWSRGSETAALHRGGVVVPEAQETDDALAKVREQLAARTRAFRRSVHIRHVDAGSDGADEWEVLALLNPVYDVHRLGIFLTASPRHADILLVTGAGSHGMEAPLHRTLEATPRPLVIIAAGTDAISGGIVSPSYATAGGVTDLVPVDVWVPGSPPSPFSLLHGILLAIGLMPQTPRPR